MSKFQIIILGLFSVFIVIGVAIFAFSNSGSGKDRSQTVLWGTIKSSLIEETIKELRLSVDEKINITYVEKSPDSLDSELTEAIAVGRGPDAVILPHNLLYQEREKLLPVSYESFAVRTFKDTFVEAGELFLSPDGILGFPLSIDPLVLYWNRSIFSAAGLARPPTLWEEFYGLVPLLSKRDDTVIKRAAVALGEFRNVLHAKDILSTLLLQAGTPIVSVSGDQPKASLNIRGRGLTPPTDSAVRFYTEFANPLKPAYTWNRSLPDSKSFFLSGDSALYLGLASELGELRDRNPNLNFDVAIAPQAGEGKGVAVFGTVYGIALVRGAKDMPSAIENLALLWGPVGAKKLSDLSGLPPARRDILAVRPENPYQSVFYRSALISSVWLDPNQVETELIFKDLVESVTSGRERLSEAISRANLELDQLF
jgi:ABC-type glycerol-3-phosphate transport system substrate-binding protein